MLDRFLSVSIPGAHFSPKVRSGIWDGRKHFFSKITNRFPAFFTDMVVDFLEEHKISVVNNVKKPKGLPKNTLKKTNINDVELRDYQLECVKACLKHGYGIIQAPTNSGKTVVIASVVKLYDKKTLILVDRKNLAEQIKARLESYGIESVDIIHSEHQEFNDSKICVCLVQSIGKIEKYLEKFELLIIDEVHKAKADGFISVVKKCKNANNRFGFSATVQKASSADGLKLIAGYGPKIFNLDVKSLIDRGDIMADPVFFMVLNDQEPLILKENLDKIDSKNKFVEMENRNYVYNLYRNALIIYIVKKLTQKNQKVFILVRRIDHGSLLSSMLGVDYIQGSTPMSERKQLIEDFEEGRSLVLLAQTEILGTGIDLKGGTDAMIVASGGNGEIGVIQKAGRALRKNDKMEVSIFDFYDNPPEERDGVFDHAKKRKKIYSNVYSSDRVFVLDIDAEDKVYKKIKSYVESQNKE